MGAYNDDLLFIHIPKCAGTSIREWLKEYVPGTTDFRDDGSGLPIGHIPLRSIERFTARRPESFKKIVAIIRNPYTHQVSQWMFWRERRAKRGIHIHDITAARHATLTQWLCDANCDFHVWYESQFGSSDAGVNLRKAAGLINRYPNHGGLYRYWVSLEDGSIPLNVQLVRMEDLDKTWLDVVGDFAVDGAPPLEHVNRGPASLHDPADVMKYYTPLALGIVNDKFQWTLDELKAYKRIEPEDLVPNGDVGHPLAWVL